MNAAVAVCPHCGKRRPDAATDLADAKLSPAEINAMLAFDSAGDAAPSRGLLQALLIPHDRTQGIARVAELVLTAVCLPMILAGVLMLAFDRRRARTREAQDAMAGEAGPVVAMIVAGTITLATILTFLVSTTTTVAVIGIEIAGLIVRAVIRSRANESNGRSLTRVERSPRP